MTAALRQNLQTAMVVVVLLSAAVFLARRPYYNWDMFPYMALVMQERGMPFDSLHVAVYETARASMPQRDFKAISSRQPVLMNSARAFQEVLPYYEVKPGYTLFARALYAMGTPALAATWLPSILAYFCLCLMLFFWARSHATLPAAALFTAIIASAPPLTDLARYSSPDMLGTCVQVAGVVMLLVNRVHTGMALLTAAITIRPDASLLAIPIALALLVSGKLSMRQAAGWSLAGALIVVFLFARTGLLGEYLLLDLSFPDRLDLYGEGLSTLLRSYFTPVAGLAMVLLFLKRRTLTSDLLPLLIMAALVSLVSRLLLHPYVEDRFNLAAYLVVLLVGWVMVTTSVFPNTRKT